MKPYYTDVSKFYEVGKSKTYEREGAYHDPLFPKTTPHLVPWPQRVVTLRSEMEVPSQIGLEVGTVIGDNLPSALVVVDVGMNRHRSCACSHACFSYKTYIEVDSMILEYSKAHEKHC